MTPQGKKTWNSPAGASLMDAMLGEKPMSEQDKATVQELVKTSHGIELRPLIDLTLRVNTRGGTTVIRLSKDTGPPPPYAGFVCAVACRSGEYRANIPDSDVDELLRFVRSATVSAVGACAEGLDGVSYELSINEGFAHATYGWWMKPASGWTPLTEIASRLLNLGFQVSGQYLP
jgi:hypothetical protein